jgi:hypothetical protein
MKLSAALAALSLMAAAVPAGAADPSRQGQQQVRSLDPQTKRQSYQEKLRELRKKFKRINSGFGETSHSSRVGASRPTRRKPKATAGGMP